MRLPARWGALIGLILLSSGCVHRVPKLELAPPRPPPALSDVTAALSAIRDVPALRASLKIELETAKGRNKVSGVMVARAPAQLRIELLSILGPPVGYAALNGQLASLYLPYSQSTFLRTDTAGPLLERLTGGMLNVSDLVRVFLGRPPLCQPAGEVEHRREDDRFLVSCQGNREQPYRLVLEPAGLRVAGVEGRTSGAGATFEARFRDYREVSGVSLPQEIEISAPDAHFHLDVKYDDLELNPEVASSLFTLAPPPGSRILPLEALFAPAGQAADGGAAGTSGSSGGP